MTDQTKPTDDDDPGLEHLADPEAGEAVSTNKLDDPSGHVAGRMSRHAIALARARKAWSMRLAGASYEKIGDALGITHQSARSYINARLSKLSRQMTEDAPVLRDQEIARLETLFETAYAHATGAPILDADGNPKLDDNGEPMHWIPDHRWMQRAESIAAQKAKLLGLDVNRSEVNVNVSGSITVVDVAALSPLHLAMLEHVVKAGALSSAAPAALPGSVALPAPSQGERVGEIVDAEVISSVAAAATSEPVAVDADDSDDA